VKTETYRVALDVRHRQDVRQVLGNAGLTTSSRPSDEPDVVMVVLAGRRSSGHCRVEVGDGGWSDLGAHAVDDEF
jgi:hypothetical protein